MVVRGTSVMKYYQRDLVISFVFFADDTTVFVQNYSIYNAIEILKGIVRAEKLPFYYFNKRKMC